MLLNKLCIDEENQSLGTGCPDPSLLYSHMYLFWKTVGEQQRFGNAFFFFFIHIDYSDKKMFLLINSFNLF